jgi:hypothetical protein
MIATRVVALYSAGVQYPWELRRRVPLYQPMYPAIARRAPARDPDTSKYSAIWFHRLGLAGHFA